MVPPMTGSPFASFCLTVLYMVCPVREEDSGSRGSGGRMLCDGLGHGDITLRQDRLGQTHQGDRGDQHCQCCTFPDLPRDCPGESCYVGTLRDHT